MSFTYEVGTLKGSEYVELVKSVGWKTGKDLILSDVDKALNATSYVVVARDSKGFVAAAGRAFSDNLTMTFIPDILVKPEIVSMVLNANLMISPKMNRTQVYLLIYQRSCSMKRGMLVFTNSFFQALACLPVRPSVGLYWPTGERNH